MAIHTDDDTVVAKAIETLLNANKTALLLEDVLYGDHTMVPRNSAAIVQPGGKQRALAGVAATGGRTENNLVVEVALHWGKVGDAETDCKDEDDRGSALERS